MRNAVYKTVEELTTLVTKGTTPTTIGGRFSDDGINFIKVESITGSGSFIPSKFAYIDEDSNRLLQRSILHKDDVLFSIAGAIGRSAVVDEQILPANTNQALAILRPNKNEILPQFLYYSTKTKNFQAQAYGRIVQAAQPNVNLTQLKSIKVLVPDRLTQETVCNIIKTYDDLIANSERRIELLEQSARMLYKEWFVRFRFPGHEHVKFKDGIPEGWRKKKIGEITNTVGGGTPSSGKAEYWEDGTVTWLTPTDITRNNCLAVLHSERKISEQGLRNSSARLVPPHTILMTSRASVGFFALADFEVSTNQGFINIIPNYSFARYYILFNLLDRVDEIRSIAGGATYAEISKSKFRLMTIIYPDERTLNLFNDFASSIIEQVRILKKEIDNLKSINNILLPRLMNGKIQV